MQTPTAEADNFEPFAAANPETVSILKARVDTAAALLNEEITVKETLYKKRLTILSDQMVDTEKEIENLQV